VTGVSVTDDALPVVVKAKYTETLDDGTELTFRNEYKINVMVYETVEAKPETYRVTLDGAAYTTARPGDKVCVYSEDDTRILTNVTADGIEITKESNPFNTGYGCFIFTMPEGDVALTGTWEEIPVYYMVQFRMNGMGTAPAFQKILAGQKVVLPNEPSAEGASFDGWFKDSEFTEAWDFEKDTVTDNTVLYAKWTHVHNYSTVWFSDSDSHWHMCNCGGRADEEVHTPDHEGGATEEYAIACSICGYEMEAQLEHVHVYSETWNKDATKHWKACACGAKSEEGEHTAGDWIVDEEASADKVGKQHKECTECGYKMEEEDIPKTCAHSFTEKIADTEHYVRGSGSDCRTPYQYYYDCAYCDKWSFDHIWVSSEYGGHDWDEDSHCSVCGITFYHVNVGGCDITSQNAADVFGDGKVSYDKTTNTLTLNGYTYSGEGTSFSEDEYAAIVCDTGIHIKLVGENTIETTEGMNAGGIVVLEGDCTISGTGTLKVLADGGGIAVAGGSITVKSGKLVFGNGSRPVVAGIMGLGVTIEDGDIDIIADACGIYSVVPAMGITVKGGTVSISTNMDGGPYLVLDYSIGEPVWCEPDVTEYENCKVMASVNLDGSDAVEYNPEDMESYKFVEIAPLVHVHNITKVDAKEATHEAAGNIEYYYCNRCEKYYKDEAATQEITEEDTVIAKEAHDFGSAYRKDEVYHWQECECGFVQEKAEHSFGDDESCSVCGYTIETVIVNPFGDVKETDWYYPYVMFAYEHDLMGGKGEMPDGTLMFDPKNSITRAEFVQILYNKENTPDVEYTDRFTDVPDGMWYTDAILWAAREEIVSGKSADSFDVNGKITRQEIAVVLYNYALYKDYDVSEAADADLTGFVDVASVANWADTGMKWAVQYELISGKPMGEQMLLAPGESATRAEAATMMKSFMVAYEGITE